MQEEPRTLSQLNDEALAQRVQQHSKEAFSVLYDRYVRLVYGMAIQMVGQEEAGEAAQEIFMRLWRKAEQFNATRGSFKSWFMMVARNYLRDQLRYHYINNQQAHLPEWQQLLEQIADPGANVVETAVSREQRRWIKEAIDTLPDEQRQVIIMAYFGGYTQSAIAKTLDWPLGTVKKRVRLGLQKLRKNIVWQEADVDQQEAVG
jgi:RNA polymerase sigma-70 factor (ECF subfamily)